MVKRQAIIHLYMGLPVLLLALLSSSSATDVSRQAQMNTCELVRDNGYSCQTLQTTTDDGYIIEVDRVGAKDQDNEKISTDNSTHGRPILLVQGIFVESGGWFLNLPSQSTGFLLADAGYDVWAMNTREIAHRSSHVSLKQTDDRYWQFSFHEMGCYDVAAMIDLVLNVTGVARVPLLVFSQGFTSTLVLLSLRPEYNNKVDMLIGYGPVGNITNIKFPMPELIAISDAAFLLLDPLRDSGYLYLPSAPAAVVKLICKIFQGQPCSLVFALTMLTSPEQVNKTRMPVHLSHLPIGTSYDNLRHYVTVYRRKNLVMFDHGTIENRKRYGQADPPAYPLENIAVPVALFSSQGDTISTPEDVADIGASLGSRLLFNHVLPETGFRHLDFLIGYQSRNMLIEPMIKTLQGRFEEGL